VTVTETVAPDSHTDVSLWFVLTRDSSRVLTPDAREFRSARWWTREQIARADPAAFDPHMGRMLGKLDQAASG
jgi:hypothetical protein